MLFELLLILCLEIPVIAKEWFNNARLCKWSKCFDNEVILRWNVARVEFFLLIVTLLKLLISWHFESTGTYWSASLSGVSMELLSVKNVFTFSLRKKYLCH